MVNKLVSFVVPILMVILLVFSTHLSSASVSSLRQGLVAYFPFDSDVNDYSGNGNHGTNSGASAIAGKVQGGYIFVSSESDYVSTPTIDPTSNYTVSFWYKLTTDSGSEFYTVLGYSSGSRYPVLLATNNDRVYSHAQGGGSQSEWVLDHNTNWRFLTIRYTSGTSAQLLVDNVSIGTQSIGGDIQDIDRIGTKGSDWYFNGILDEVTIWNRSLSDSEISELYNSGGGLSLGVPTITIISPVNATYYNTNNITINFTGSNFDNLFYNNGSGANVSYTNGTVQYFISSDGQYNFTFYANNSAGITSEVKTFWIDTIKPQISYGSGTENDQTNFSRTNIYVNVSVTELNSKNITFFLFNSTSTVNITSFTMPNYLSNNSINWTSLPNEVYTFNVTIFDLAGNTNSTESRTIRLDTTPPIISSVSYSPNTNNSIDPNTNITFNATLTDNLIGVNSVLLQVYNGTWINYTMSRISGNITNGIYQYNFTTSSVQTNYTFNVYANDSLLNSNNSINQTFFSNWDCTWNITTTGTNYYLGSTGGFNQDIALGNVTFTNTGDIQYGNNNCSIVFAKTTSGDSWYDGSSGYDDDGALLNFSQTYYLKSGNKGLQYFFNGSQVTSLTLNATENKTLTVKGRFPRSTTVLTEYPAFPIFSSISDSENRQNNVTINARMIITPGAYLETSIDSPSTDPYIIYLTPSNISFTAYVKNLVDASSNAQNNTAYNVSFNWTIPSSIITIFNYSILNNTYDKLNTTNKNYINLTLSLDSSNLGGLSQTNYSLLVYTFGYENSTGNFSLINHTSSQIISDSIVINFQCYTASDGIQVSSCGTLDPDNPVSSGSSSSGGGGGGGGAGAGPVTSKADYFVVRGKTTAIELEFKNKDENRSMTDIEFTISGKLSKYLRIIPDKIGFLSGGQTAKLKLEITSPTYLPLGLEEITLNIHGQQGGDYNENRRIFLKIVEISEEDVKKLIEEDKKLIEQFHEQGFEDTQFDLLINESITILDTFDYSKILANDQIIKGNIGAALDANKIIQVLKTLIAEAQEKEINTDNSERLVELAQLSLDRKDYQQAYLRAKEAQTAYALEVKGELGSLSYYLKNNKKEISLGLIVLVLLIFAGTKLTRYNLLKLKVKRLREEEKILTGLIKTIQEKTFKEKKMDMEEYYTSISQYEKRLQLIIEQLIDSENQITFIFKMTSLNKRLIYEKKILIDMLKQLQTDYLKRKIIDSRVYDLKLQSLNRRIGEIDTKLAEIEANQALKGKIK